MRTRRPLPSRRTQVSLPFVLNACGSLRFCLFVNLICFPEWIIEWIRKLTQAAVTYFYLRSCLFTRLQHGFSFNKELQTLPDHLISFKCFCLFSALVVSTTLSWCLFIFVSPMHSLCFDDLLRSLWKITMYYALVFYIFLYSLHFTLFKAE